MHDPGEGRRSEKKKFKPTYERGSSIPDEYKNSRGEIDYDYEPEELDIDTDKLIRSGEMIGLTDKKLRKPKKKKFRLPKRVKAYAKQAKKKKFSKPRPTAQRSFKRLRKNLTKTNPYKKQG